MNYASWDTMRHNKPETMSDEQSFGLICYKNPRVMPCKKQKAIRSNKKKWPFNDLMTDLG